MCVYAYRLIGWATPITRTTTQIQTIQSFLHLTAAITDTATVRYLRYGWRRTYRYSAGFVTNQYTIYVAEINANS